MGTLRCSGLQRPQPPWRSLGSSFESLALPGGAAAPPDPPASRGGYRLPGPPEKRRRRFSG
eukprot:6820642-Alexandrium_andersonii.AAC.1